TYIFTLSLHDALPILKCLFLYLNFVAIFAFLTCLFASFRVSFRVFSRLFASFCVFSRFFAFRTHPNNPILIVSLCTKHAASMYRSEEHTSELQSRSDL